MSEDKNQKHNEGFAIFIIIVLALLLTGNFAYNSYSNSKNDDSWYMSKQKEAYSVKTDILNPQYYFVVNNLAIPDSEKNSKSKIFNNLVETYDGKSYVYNEDELYCYFFTRNNNSGQDTGNTYKEVKNNKLVIYAENKVGIRTGTVTKYYKEKECSNIYMIKKEDVK